jgi:acetyltransferase-like isoleucine patch superfamily enzyme
MSMCIHCGRYDCDRGFECERRRKASVPPPRERMDSSRDLATKVESETLAAMGAFAFSDTRFPFTMPEGSFVDPTVTIRRPHLFRLGKHSNVDHGFYCTSGLEVEDYCHIAANAVVIGGAASQLRMMHFSTLGAHSTVVTASEEADGLYGPTIPRELRTVKVAPVVFEPMAAVTTGCTILPGVILGLGCVIGAGAVVLKSTDPWGIYAGVPARKIGERPRLKCLAAARELGYEFRP